MTKKFNFYVYTPTINENICPTNKNLYVNVYSSFTRNRQKMETNQMSINR